MLEWGYRKPNPSMEDHSSHSEDELSVAAIAYIPPMCLLFYPWRRWRKNYFTHYHIAHAILLNISNILLLSVIVALNFWLAGWTGYSFILLLISGGVIATSLLGTATLLFFCAYQAYRGRFVVLPLLTRLYYGLFEKHWFQQRAMRTPGSYTKAHFEPYVEPTAGQKKKISKPPNLN